MSNNYASHVGTKKTQNATPQTAPIPGREAEMAKNFHGGYTFVIPAMTHVRRFLILGTHTFDSLDVATQEAAESLKAAIEQDGIAVVREIVEISEGGRAAKNDPAIFALAYAATVGNQETKNAAYAAVPRVCRIGTHLFQFCEAIQHLRGWSRGLRKAVARFYTQRDNRALAVQLVKYRQREGWTHRDVLRLSHAKPATAMQSKLFKYVTAKEDKDRPALTELHFMVQGFERLQSLTKNDTKEAIDTIDELTKAGEDVSWELLPTELLKEKKIWEALLPKMKMGALIRNLGRLSSLGMLEGGRLSQTNKEIAARFLSVDMIKKARLHPVQILTALKTYGSGHGVKGNLTWTPDQYILESLDEAFYLSFDTVEPTGQNTFIALDVSGSMGSQINGSSTLTHREVVSAFAMVTMRTEPNYYTMGFSNSFIKLPLTPKMRLEEVCRIMERLPFNTTDCAIPMLEATKMKLDVDVFQVMTDNETFAGAIQPSQALKTYRDKLNKPKSKLLVFATQATMFTIADPKDPYMLDISGFDSSVPQQFREFALL